MRQLSASLLALALGSAAAVALVSCGGGNDADLLPGDTASEINANLDMVRELSDSGDCAGAQSAAQQVSDQVEALGGVDKRLKQALLEGAEQLNAVVADCVETTTESIAPASIPTTAESTTEPSEEKEKKPKKDEEDEEDDTPPVTPDTPAETTPTTPAPTPPAPTDGGGTGAPGGVSPGDAVDEDE